MIKSANSHHIESLIQSSIIVLLLSWTGVRKTFIILGHKRVYLNGRIIIDTIEVCINQYRRINE